MDYWHQFTFSSILQGVSSGCRLSLVDSGCSAVCPTLPRLVGIWQKWLGKTVEHSNQSQPNTVLWPDGTPCSAISYLVALCNLIVSADLFTFYPKSCEGTFWICRFSTASRLPRRFLEFGPRWGENPSVVERLCVNGSAKIRFQGCVNFHCASLKSKFCRPLYLLSLISFKWFPANDLCRRQG